MTINVNRRRLLAGTAVAAAALATGGVARAAAIAPAPAMGVRQVRAGLLDVGVHFAGPEDGPPVILLHGFPYDIHSYVDVAPLLAAAGCRVIVPYLRGHGTTRFLSADTPRVGQQSAVARDIIDLMDALGIERAVLAGYDWGSRTACVAAALWPERVAGVVSVNGYLIQDVARGQQPIAPAIEHGQWYQFYFATERGRAGLEANRREIARIIWKTNSPDWHFDDATFARSAAALENPDYVAVVIHNYRYRLGLAQPDARYAALEQRLARLPALTVPAITLDGAADGIVPPNDGTAQAAKFKATRSHRIVPGAGHNLPQEAPRAFADAVLALVPR